MSRRSSAMATSWSSGARDRMPDSCLNRAALFAGAALGAAAVLAVDALLIEPARVQVTQHSLPLPDLPLAWEGARVVHLTDLHYGGPRSEALLAWMVRVVNDLNPDLIAITGDFVLNRL